MGWLSNFINDIKKGYTSACAKEREREEYLERCKKAQEIERLRQRWESDENVKVVRKWYSTILQDLCLSNIPLHFFDQEMSCGDFVILENGQVLVRIGAPKSVSEEELLNEMLQTLRKLWQWVYTLPRSWEDAEEYAKRFLQRYPEPKADPYQGPVSPYDWIRVS